ncbi:hypothetical protein NC652_001466 [Populus alba x Populus x berolinensis]|uniref:Uncharacterized protein n=1 Tax=Populus tomentosa TaxID=118781 RepID=A0A8X8DHB7_POPTO|nr:hypothetical protein POTOM_001102 [Populus tomentosa]KAJ6962839.1 hypothetical protein NC652_001466 [Populus alba x Populus x berolinensis]
MIIPTSNQYLWNARSNIFHVTSKQRKVNNPFRGSLSTPLSFPGQKGINQENTMVLVKAMLKSLVLFLVLFASSVSVHSVAGEAVGKNNVAKSYRSWRRINHGSARGPRKHLVNPTVEHPFEVPELPV